MAAQCSHICGKEHHDKDVKKGKLPADYDSGSGAQKTETLWKLIQQEPYTPANLPTALPGQEGATKLFDPTFLLESFLHTADTLAEGRKKVIHPYGAAAKIELLIWPNSRYSGLFKSGGPGIIRLSLAAFNYEHVATGSAIKLLLDGPGHPSHNLILMNVLGLDGQGADRNFFLHPHSNIMITPRAPQVKAVIDVAFVGALARLPGGGPGDPDKPQDATNLALLEPAGVTANGEPVKHVVAPWKIVLLPNHQLRASQSAFQKEDFRVALGAIPAGTVLYDVVAYRTPEEQQGDSIGRIVSRSGFVASPFVDEGLFFQHARKRWQKPQ